MWGDLLLLPMANAAIVPHLTAGLWIPLAVAAAIATSVALHIFWYRAGAWEPQARPGADTCGDHMWPARVRGTWNRDLSRAGWAHVFYVTGQLVVLAGFLIHAMPADVVLFVTAVFTLHVPIGLLQPRYRLTGHIATVAEQPLLLPALLALWGAAALKM
jgi:hypothetical protein